MAKFAARPIVIAMPRRRGGGRLRRYASRGVASFRRGGRARKALPTVGIALGGAVVGYLQGTGRLDFLPEVGGSRMVTLGLAGYAATRMSSNAHIRAAGLAALASAAFDFGRAQGGGTHGESGWDWDNT